jgi:hypothetical protein
MTILALALAGCMPSGGSSGGSSTAGDDTGTGTLDDPFQLTGDIAAPSATPGSFEAGEFESDQVIIWQENDSVELQSSVSANISEPGVYGSPQDYTPVVLGEGDEFRSFFIHFDPVGSADGGRSVQAEITFPDGIEAIALSDESLSHSDTAFRDSSISYPGTAAGRGLELESGDEISVSADGRVLSVTLFEESGVDQLRVFTKPSASAPTECDFQSDCELGTSCNFEGRCVRAPCEDCEDDPGLICLVNEEKPGGVCSRPECTTDNECDMGAGETCDQGLCTAGDSAPPEITDVSIDPSTISQADLGGTTNYEDMSITVETVGLDGWSILAVDVFLQLNDNRIAAKDDYMVDNSTITLRGVDTSWFVGLEPGRYSIGATLDFRDTDGETGVMTTLDLAAVDITP